MVSSKVSSKQAEPVGSSKVSSKQVVPVGRAISNRNVMNAKFKTAQLDGEWQALLGNPELCNSWTIWGKSGMGKTTFALLLTKYLSQFVGKVAYNSLEQGLSASLTAQWKLCNMAECGSKVILLKKETLPELKERLRRRGSPDIVVIDSLMCIVGMRMTDYLSLLKEHPKKLFIFLAHEDDRGKPSPAIAEKIRRLSDIKIRIEGFKAFSTSRFAGETEPFVIWEEGAKKYYAEV